MNKSKNKHNNDIIIHSILFFITVVLIGTFLIIEDMKIKLDNEMQKVVKLEDRVNYLEYVKRIDNLNIDILFNNLWASIDRFNKDEEKLKDLENEKEIKKN